MTVWKTETFLFSSHCKRGLDCLEEDKFRSRQSQGRILAETFVTNLIKANQVASFHLLLLAK
jgi:hypothetical protein